MDQQLYERILHEFRDCCRFCTHYPLSSTETPCHSLIEPALETAMPELDPAFTDLL